MNGFDETRERIEKNRKGIDYENSDVMMRG
jgi:hypothetical protein